MRYWYQDPQKGWSFTDNDIYIKIWECLQECILWKGENAYDVNMGIDYESIFNSTNFLTSQLENVLDKYRSFFKDIISNVEKVDNKVVVSLQFWINSQYENQGGIASAISAELSFDRMENFNVSIR